MKISRFTQTCAFVSFLKLWEILGEDMVLRTIKAGEIFGEETLLGKGWESHFRYEFLQRSMI